MLGPLYTTLALQICQDRITFSVYAIFSILMHALNYSHGPFHSVKSQIHREDVQSIGQETENSSTTSSDRRISSNSTVIQKINATPPVALLLNFRYFTSLRYWKSMAFLELRFLI